MGFQIDTASAYPTSTPLDSLLSKVQSQLKDSDFKSINCSQTACNVDTIILKEGLGILSDNSYLDKEVYLVEFINSNSKTLPNNLIIYVTMDTEKIIGYRFVN